MDAADGADGAAGEALAEDAATATDAVDAVDAVDARRMMVVDAVTVAGGMARGETSGTTRGRRAIAGTPEVEPDAAAGGTIPTLAGKTDERAWVAVRDRR